MKKYYKVEYLGMLAKVFNLKQNIILIMILLLSSQAFLPLLHVAYQSDEDTQQYIIVCNSFGYQKVLMSVDGTTQAPSDEITCPFCYIQALNLEFIDATFSAFSVFKQLSVIFHTYSSATALPSIDSLFQSIRAPPFFR
jgi:hypothetical protein